jgi:hypothetical protein
MLLSQQTSLQIVCKSHYIDFLIKESGIVNSLVNHTYITTTLTTEDIMDNHDGEDIMDNYDGEDIMDNHDGEDIMDNHDGEDIMDNHDGEDIMDNHDGCH